MLVLLIPIEIVDNLVNVHLPDYGRRHCLRCGCLRSLCSLSSIQDWLSWLIRRRRFDSISLNTTVVLTLEEHSLVCAPNCLRLNALALEQDDILEIDISIAIFAAAQEVESILEVGVVGVDTLTRIGCE